MIRRTFLFVFGALACSLSLNAQLQITPAINATDAEYMVENVLIGNGVAVSNITVNGQSVGTSNNFGMFQNGNSTNLGLASGIVLSSGNISAIPNPGSVFSSVVLGLSGDPVLQTIATEATYDVTYLEFDFVPLDTFIRFRYVFGSEEYPEYVGDLYNDVFGFFITGANPAGGAYTNYNIARIPGSNTVVSINNVNASSNSQYYVNNETGNTVVFDGMTTVLTAYADVEPCQLYHMKIAVGDVYDEVYDSGVFLEANSFTNNGNYDIPMVDLGPDMAVCEGSSVVVDAGAGYTSYLWSTGDTTQTVTVDTASLGSGQQLLSVVVGNLSGCQGGDEIRINFINTSNYSLGADRQACADIPISLDAGAGFSSYIWSTGATTRTITLYAQDFPGGTGTISVNVATAQGCEATDSVEISFLPSPAVTITGNTVVCPNQSFTLSVATGFTGYFWSTGSGTNTESIDTSKTGYGPTDVIAIVTGANGCHGKDTVTVNFTRPVIAFAGADDHFCSLEDSYALLAATADQGTTYLWTSSGTGSFINAAQLNTSYEISSQDSTNGNVSLYLLASNACFSDNDTINIIIEDSAIVFAGSDSAICPGQNLLLTASGGAGNYSWTPSYGLSDTTIANPLANPATTTTYIVSMTSACGLATDDITVTIRQNPTANITGDTAKCAVDTITLNAGSVFASYYWSNGSHTADFIYYESVPGTYPIWVTVTDVFGCMDSDTAQIIVHPQPAIDLGADLTGCLNGSVLIDGGNGFESYLWTGGDTNQILMVDSTMQGAGIASYIVIVTDNYGCTNSDTIALTMFQNPVTNISGDTSFCINSSVILDAGAGFNSYSWNTGGTGRFLFVDSAIVGTGSTQISVIAYDANGCDATDQITMHVSGFPSGTAGNSGFFCASDTLLILNNAQVDVAESFFWTTTGSGVLDDSTAIHPSYGLTFQDSTGGIVDFILTIQTFCDILYDTITFNILHAAIADAGSDLEVCAGSSVIIQTTGPGTEFSWSPVTGLSDTLSASPTASPQITTIYTVTVSTACGTASDDVTVVVNELPTIFLGPDTLICANATIDLNAGPNFSTYNWSTGGSAQVEIIDSTGTGLGSTFVFVEVTDTNGCAGRDTIVITFDACAGINTSNIAEIALFPNPTSGSISLVSDINLAGGLFTVVNQDGKIVLQSYLGYSTTYKFDLSDLAPGTYLIRIEYEGKTQGRLLIRQ